MCNHLCINYSVLYNNFKISPLLSIILAYIFLLFSAISIFYLQLFSYSNNYFNWGPPVKIFNITITNYFHFYWIFFLFFLNEIINSLLSEVVYSWIINCIQDPKSKNTIYSRNISITIVFLYIVYVQLNLIFIINGSISQISFFIATLLGSLSTSGYINWKYINRIHSDNREYQEIIPQ